ncbi:hypothetical protein JOF56_002319 [Kibdelosporangium banguiense]|uniref:DUF3558 domain-containing protein n=1 Tax=Kibdelosporangium banguiense TaxID=1365924 RepID=A0ABS4TC77_9PSEU|nr:hypothetical protein [Kibdelosporangium banguiense]MBP2321934.1 hypothetical protein [Kibdelosporangium banguiense]
MPGRALVGIGSAMLATGMLTACGAVNDQWDLPMSPLERPSDIPLDNQDICATLHAYRTSTGCKVMAESGTAEILVIPRFGGDLRRYSDEVDGELVRWVGINKFPAIQLANSSGSDGVASCRVALDVAPGQILLIVYRQQAADPRLAPCRPARDFAAKAISELQSRSR